MIRKKEIGSLLIMIQCCFFSAVFSNSYATTTTTSLKPDSAKECAICHYSWVETFFYDKRGTVLAPLPAAPKVATSKMCFSCHDGSTVDSRQQVYNDRMHQVGVIPSEKVKIPETFPLDEEGKMDCGTCHSAHTLATEPGIEKTIFLRTANENSEMCKMCHVDNEGGPEKGNHPLGKSTLSTVKEITRYGGSLGTEPNQVICESCHVAHGGFTQKRLVLPVDNPASSQVLCEVCHSKQPSLSKEKITGRFAHPLDLPPGLTINLPEHWDNGQQMVLGKGGEMVCRTCHIPHGSASPKALLTVRNEKDSLCVQCHKEQSEITDTIHYQIVINKGEKDVEPPQKTDLGSCSPCHLAHDGLGELITGLPIDVFATKPGELCTSCHSPEGVAEKVMPDDFSHPRDINVPETAKPLILPLYDDNGIAANGKIRCSTCHTYHNPFPVYDDSEDETVKHGTYLRYAERNPEYICIQCHPQHGLVEGTDHDLTITDPDFINVFRQTPAQGGICSPCHVAHRAVQQRHLWSGPIGPVILEGWVDEYKVEGDMMTALCTGCHFPGESGEKQVPEFGLHPKGFLIPPESVPGEPVVSFEMLKDEYPIFTPTGEIAESGNIVCSTCHNPHQWDPRVDKKGPGKETEGCACDSFLRPKLDAKFCTLCHGFKGILMLKYFHSHLSREKREGTFSFEKKKIQ
jgi:predicted CXXCH cytochrome family protein